MVTVFLDFDGVICTEGSYKVRYKYLWQQIYPNRYFPSGRRRQQFVDSMRGCDDAWHLTFQPECCGNVQTLLHFFPDSKLVLSTSWRHMFSLEEISGFLRANGIITPISGVTPMIGHRGAEIQAYCEEQGLKDTEIVALEDEEDLKPYNHRRVMTSFHGSHAGFRLNHLKHALRLLKDTP